ncbi:hypothetical protein Hypma_014305 [Hypsizygus marmoreus]|uniref:Uncharacterized protein n=1 Tax=Hypsizygus marmoreus TaxID=39966 RepID=A0A369JEW7_HYPMA|nr:hypothetical protein Hypma_014305 [Hypsizygus marmoreus]
MTPWLLALVILGLVVVFVCAICCISDHVRTSRPRSQLPEHSRERAWSTPSRPFSPSQFSQSRYRTSLRSYVAATFAHQHALPRPPPPMALSSIRTLQPGPFHPTMVRAASNDPGSPGVRYLSWLVMGRPSFCGLPSPSIHTMVSYNAISTLSINTYEQIHHYPLTLYPHDINHLITA